jgi:hypothetical protein
MKKKTLPKKLQLSRETLRDLHQPMLAEAAGGKTLTCNNACGSGANTACFATCLCDTNLC